VAGGGRRCEPVRGRATSYRLDIGAYPAERRIGCRRWCRKNTKCRVERAVAQEGPTLLPCQNTGWRPYLYKSEAPGDHCQNTNLEPPAPDGAPGGDGRRTPTYLKGVNWHSHI